MTERTWTVAPQGMGAFSCDLCGNWFSKAECDTISQRHYARCTGCGRNRQLTQVKVSVLSDSARHMDLDTVRGDLWYHSTTSATWMEDIIECEEEDFAFLSSYRGEPMVDTTLMVHLGTVEAALDRHRERLSHETVYMYVLRIADWAPIAEAIKTDENDECPVIAQDCPEQGYSVGITRYVNLFESPGSISLLANRSMIEIVDRMRLS